MTTSPRSGHAYERMRSDGVLDRLCATSRDRYNNPYEALEWPDVLDRSQWFTSPELISVFGTQTWHELDVDARMRLSFWEAVNFYSLNIHGEKSLMAGLASRLYDPDKRPIAEFLHHMLDEENKHSVYFGGFCENYAGKVYPDRKVVLGQDPPEASDFLFFVRVMVFEEIVDRYNVVMSRDDRLVPVARFINENHHLEETRHLAFGRRMVRELFREGLQEWSPELLAELRAHIVGFVRQTWREFYNPAVYADAGLPEPWRLALSAHDAPAAREHRAALTSRCLRFLQQAGILEERPVL